MKHEEFNYEAVCGMIGTAVQSKKENKTGLIVGADKHHVFIGCEEYGIHFDEFLENWNFVGGASCGYQRSTV